MKANPTFYECGSCDSRHPVGFYGDCRDDSNRFAPHELDEIFGPYNWDEIEMECGQ